jgi:hypothetical protein
VVTKSSFWSSVSLCVMEEEMDGIGERSISLFRGYCPKREVSIPVSLFEYRKEGS